MEIWKLMWRSATSTPFSEGPKNNNKNPVSNTNSGIMQKISKWPDWLFTILWSCATFPTEFPTNTDLSRKSRPPWDSTCLTVTLFQGQKWQKASQLSSAAWIGHTAHSVGDKVSCKESLWPRNRGRSKATPNNISGARDVVSRANRRAEDAEKH